MPSSSNTRTITSTMNIWRSQRSLLLTVVLLIAIELLDNTLFKIPNPAPVYLTAVVYAAFRGELLSGFLSAGMTLLYAFYYFSTPGQLFHYTDDNFRRVIILAVTTPAIAVMVGTLSHRVEQLAHEQATRQSNEAHAQSFRDFVQGLNAIVWEREPVTSQFVFVSQQAKAMLGYPVEQWLNEPNFWANHLHPEDREQIEQKYREAILTGKNQDLEFRSITADGHVVWLRDNVSVVKDASDRVTRISGVMVDISERKQTEELLKRYQLLSEHSRDIVLFVRTDGQIIEANNAALKAYGYARQELLSLKIDALREPQTHALIAEQMEQADKEGILFETMHRRQDGSCFPVEISAQSTVIGNEKVILSIIRDITQRKHTEKALSAANKRIADILESITDAFVAFDQEWRYTYVNEEAARLLQKSRQELLGKQLWQDIFPASVDNIFYREFHRAVAEQVPIEFVAFSEALNIWVEVHLYPSAEGLAVYFRDITARKRAEENQQKLVSIVENSLDFIGIATLEGQPLYVNDAGQKLVGFESLEDVRQTALLDYFMPEDKAYVQQHILPAIMTQGFWEGEFRFRHFKTGQPIPVYYNLFATKDRQTGQPIGVATVTRDMTDAYRQATQRKRAELALQESEARFRRLFESNLIGVAFWNIEGFIIDANDAFLGLAGYTREEFAEIGRIDWRDCTPPEYKHLDERAIEEAMATGVSSIYEKEYVHRDGRRVPIVLGIALLNNSQHDGVAFVLDITERKQVEEVLRESNRRVTNILESITDAFVALDCEWRITYVNQETARLSGQKPEEMIGKTHWEQWPWSVGTIVEREYRRAVTEQVAVHFEVLYALSSTWLEIHAYPSQNGLSIYFRDISEQKQIEQSLQVNRERLDLVLKATELGLWYCDLPFDKLEWNDKCKEHFGLTPDTEVTIAQFYTQLHPDDRERTRIAIEQSIEQRSGYDIDYRTVASDGRVRWIRAIGRGFYDAMGKPIRFDGITVDITERKRAEEERDREAAERQRLLKLEQAARSEAEAANRIKDEFLAVLSHELRSPLNPILGWTNLLRSRKLDEATTVRALETIERNAKLQAQLIEDLLDVSRILRGKLSLNVSAVNLNSTIEGAIETVRLAAQAKSVEIQTWFDPAVGQVSGDANRLQQVIWNLLSNAVKFTPSGGRVEVRLERLDTYAQIQVSDTGKGINPDFLPYVFDYFRQADSTTTRVFGGLGLGLAIVRHLVELHGGCVFAASLGEDLGATFTVRLPLMKVKSSFREEKVLPNHSPNLEGVRVLVVDDEVDTREFLVFLLEEYGAQVTAFASAAEVLTSIAKLQPDILLSDIGMPEMDGYMLIRQIRAMPPSLGGEIKAIALTAYAGETDHQQVLKAGFQKHITKPVDLAELVTAIADLIGHHP